jgi:hypothetical protein
VYTIFPLISDFVKRRSYTGMVWPPAFAGNPRTRSATCPHAGVWLARFRARLLPTTTRVSTIKSSARCRCGVGTSSLDCHFNFPTGAQPRGAVARVGGFHEFALQEGEDITQVLVCADGGVVPRLFLFTSTSKMACDGCVSFTRYGTREIRNRLK